MSEDRGVALCLNSSFLGFFAHAGFLEALTQLGVRPAALSGASAGSVVAGAYAAGLTPRETIDWLLSAGLGSAFWEWGCAWRIFGTFMNRSGHTGILRGHGAVALLRKKFGDRRIEDCRPRLALAATDLIHPRAELLTSGPLAEAIVASGAFPGMFAAQRIQGGQYWDGGLANPVPFDHWIGDPEIGTILIHSVVNPENDAGPAARARMCITAAGAIAHVIICDELMRLKLELARRAGKRVIHLQTLAPRPRPWNTRTVGPQCVALGAATVTAGREELAGLAGGEESGQKSEVRRQTFPH